MGRGLLVENIENAEGKPSEDELLSDCPKKIQAITGVVTKATPK